MSLFGLLSLLVVLAALASYLNYRVLHLPATIGVMVIALAFSLAIVAIGALASGVREQAIGIVGQIDFSQAVLHGMLALLLFAGALHLDLAAMAKERALIALLSTVGTVISTVLVGLGMFGAFRLLGLETKLHFCLLFGALISPTDPIAVLAIMQQVGAPKRLEIQMAGESLFNDGVGAVLFLTMLQLAAGPTTPTLPAAALLFLKEFGGGLLLGLLTGSATYLLLKKVDDYQVEILLTLALAMGGYALADALHVSAPIAAVVAGLFIGNHGRTFAMSPRTREHLDSFWELIDSMLNAVLFLLLGLEVMVLPFDKRFLLVGLLAIPVTLLSRWLSVASLVAPLRQRFGCARGTIRVLTWGALRGGLSVALAFSLPAGEDRNLLLTVAYMVVIFSMVVQCMTIRPLIRRVCAREIRA